MQGELGELGVETGPQRREERREPHAQLRKEIHLGLCGAVATGKVSDHTAPCPAFRQSAELTEH